MKRMRLPNRAHFMLKLQWPIVGRDVIKPTFLLQLGIIVRLRPYQLCLIRTPPAEWYIDVERASEDLVLAHEVSDECSAGVQLHVRNDREGVLLEVEEVGVVGVLRLLAKPLTLLNVICETVGCVARTMSYHVDH